MMVKSQLSSAKHHHQDSTWQDNPVFSLSFELKIFLKKIKGPVLLDCIVFFFHLVAKDNIYTYLLTITAISRLITLNNEQIYYSRWQKNYFLLILYLFFLLSKLLLKESSRKNSQELQMKSFVIL